MESLQEIKRFAIGKGLYQSLQFDESQAENSPFSQWSTRIVCEDAESDPFIVPLHWHKYHVEYMSVLEGRIEVTIEWKKQIVTPSDGEVVIPARLVHGLRGFKGERMVMVERTTPPGDYKARFFNDLLSVGMQPGFSGASFWHTMRAFYDGDAYPALGLYFQFFDIAYITVFGLIAKLFVPAQPQKLE